MILLGGTRVFALTCPGAGTQTPPTTCTGCDATGWWTPDKIPWGGTPNGRLTVHAALLRSQDSTTTSEVVAWGLDSLVYTWMFNPLDEIPCPDWTNWRFTNAPANIFCAGLNLLYDGSLLVEGGFYGDDIGIKATGRYKPSGAHLSRWSSSGSMANSRWYPTSTALGSGKVMVNSGAKGFPFFAFGGLTASGPTPQLIPFLNGEDYTWLGDKNTTPKISAREGSATTYAPAILGSQAKSGGIIFGGRNGSTFYNDVWVVRYLHEFDIEELYQEDSITVNSGSFRPPLLSQSAAAWAHYDSSNDTTLWLFGGMDSLGAAKQELWRLRITNNSTLQGTWERINGASGTPPARWGHLMFYDPGPCHPGGSGSVSPRLLVFGGEDGSHTFGDLYAYNIAANSWSKLIESQAAFQKSGACGAYANYGCDLGSDRLHQRIFIYGGRDGSGTLSSSALMLWRDEPSTANSNQAWHVSVLPTCGTAPSARTRAAAAFDEHLRRVLVSGGDVGQSTPSYSSELWALKTLRVADTASTSYWAQQYPGGSFTARAGHAMLIAGGGDLVRDNEIFDPMVPDASSLRWTTVTGAPKFQLGYPLVFQLPSERVITVGGRDSTWILKLPPTPTWQNLPTGHTFNSSAYDFQAGSAAMPLGGMIFKCGGAQGDQTKNKLGWLELPSASLENPATASWAGDGITLKKPRTQLNLVLLPDTTTLILGGINGDGEKCDGTLLARTPELWMPPDASDGAWHLRPSPPLPALADDPACRNYHSSALLLPDARVLSMGGAITTAGSDAFTATVYWPPYLFSGDTLAARPKIVSATDTVVAGDSLKFIVRGGPIKSACLMRPGAVTHGFNQSQLFIPLSLPQVCQSTDTSFGVRIPWNGPRGFPASKDSLPYPKGDYMLFVVDSHGVPSVAKWVRVGNQTSSYSLPPQLACGGGEEEGCPLLEVKTDAGWLTENTILNRSTDGTAVDDAYRVKGALAPGGSAVHFRIREPDQEVTTLDRAQLLVVDHPSNARAFVRKGEAILTRSSSAVSAWSAAGKNMSAELASAKGIEGFAGDTVTVDLGQPSGMATGQSNGAVPGIQSVMTGGSGGASVNGVFKGKPKNVTGASPQSIDAQVLKNSGVLVQVPAGNGEWRTALHYFPREFQADAFLDSVPAGLVRLVFLGHHVLRGLAREDFVGAAASIHYVSATTATHSRHGDQLAAIAFADSAATQLSRGDTLNLEFELPAAAEGEVRDVYFVSRGVYTADLSGARGSAPRPIQALVFALSQNSPNPFSRETLIRFEIPEGSPTKLGIYDVQGRLVRLLVDRPYGAGSWSVAWDRRTDAGVRAPAGVYFSRLSAGGGVQEKKLMVLR